MRIERYNETVILNGRLLEDESRRDQNMGVDHNELEVSVAFCPH